MSKGNYFGKTAAVLLISATALVQSCSQPQQEKAAASEEDATMEEMKAAVVYDTGSPVSMMKAVSEACGGLDQLKALNDVEFDYHYLKPDGKKDISTERYIFDQEVSWARYTVHEENVSPDLEGDVVQFFDGQEAKAFNNGEPLNDPTIMGMSQFLRQANYMWFNMMFKFADPGTQHDYVGQQEFEGGTYDVVKVTYDPAATGKEVNDMYVLYINPETHLVEWFKFSLPAMGVEQPLLLAKLQYEEIDGIQVVVRRRMFSPNPEGGDRVPMVDQQLKNIRFNNGFTAEALAKDV